MKRLADWILIAFVISIASSCVDEMAEFQPGDVNKWESFTTSDGLGENSTKSLFVDSQDRIWAGSDYGGVSVFDGVSFVNYTTIDGLLSNNVTAIVEDKSTGDMWFGTDAGISILDEENNWYFWNSINGDPFSIMAMLVDNNFNLWLATQEYGLLFLDSDGLMQYWDEACFDCNFVNDIIQSRDSKIWFATNGGLKQLNGSTFKRFTVDDGLPDNQIWSLFEDVENRLWVGTLVGGNVAYYENNNFKQVSLDNGLNVNGIIGIAQGSDGSMWFGSFNNGLMSYDGIVTRTFPMINGVPLDGVYDVKNDLGGNIWVASFDNGLFRYVLP